MARERTAAASLLAPVLALAACAAGAPRGGTGGAAGAPGPPDAAAPDVVSSPEPTPEVGDPPAVEAGPEAAPPEAGLEVASERSADPAPEAGVEAAPETSSTGCAGLFCEDFETGALDAARWIATSGTNHVDDATPPAVIASDRAAHGKYAAHFHGKGNVPNDDAFIVTKTLPAALAVHHFGRLYFYVSTKPTSGHTMWVVGGSAAMSANPKLRDFEVATINGGWQLGFDQLGMSPSGEEVFYPQGQVPVARWTCLEWELNDQPDSDRLWVDGKDLGALDDQHVNYPPGHVAGTALFDGNSSGLVGGFTAYSVGFFDWHPNADFDLYFDDIVLDTKRVGCL
jgi:hypothetical protein